MKRLLEKHLIVQSADNSQKVGLQLSFDGWTEYERLRQEVTDSKTAFMAMDYHNDTLAEILAKHFTPAVFETGFNLYRMDENPAAGIIDDRMRVEIRAAKFLVCDLTNDNRGAYWEAGFAEGAGKPVFYTCERSKFEAAKPHFDTEHLYTIKWDATNPAKAADELKAAVRNRFPVESIPPDLSKER